MSRRALKATFVLENRALPRAQIVALGAKRGVPVSRSYVAKVLQSNPAPKVKRAAVQPAAVLQPAPAASPEPSVADLRTEFLRLVFRIGTDRMQEWIASLRP